MKTINIQVSSEEVNKLLAALGNMPYVQVYQLVEKIRNQAESQLIENQNGQQQKLKEEYSSN